MSEAPDAEECQQMLDRIYAFHDQELSEEEMDEIRQHLLACEPCLDHYEVEHAMRLLIRRGCRESAPDELRVRVHASLAVSQSFQS